MADEITMQGMVSLAHGALSLNMNVSKTATQATAGGVQRRQTITTSDTVITLTGVTASRIIIIKNTDSTNFIDIGPTSAGAIIDCVRLKAGEVCMMPLVPSVVLRGQADTASVIIEFLILET